MKVQAIAQIILFAIIKEVICRNKKQKGGDSNIISYNGRYFCSF